MNEYGPLTKKVIAYQDTVKRLVPTAKSPEDWVAPLGEFIAVDGFERIGPFLDVQNFTQYTEMVNGWAQGTTRLRHHRAAHLRVAATASTSRSKNATRSVT